MRKLLLTLAILICLVTISQAQAPAFFNYQGVARNSVGNALVNKTIKLRLTIREGSALGIVLYSETRVLTTNAFGLFNVQVGGAGATNTIGSMAGITWNVGSKYMQVEIDPENGNNLKDIGTTQLTSVPYALYANQSSDVVLPFVKSQNEESPLFKVTNTGNNANSLSYEGITNSTANNAAAVRGIITSVSPGVFSAAVVGQNNGTTANGIGVYGNQNGSGWGVYGTTPGGVGVYGNSNSGTGVYGQSVTGVSVMGFQPNTGTSNAGMFQNTSTTNTAAALRVQTNGIGEGLNVNQTGLGKGTIVAINNAASGNNVMEVSTNGSGKVASIQNTGSGNNSNVLEVLTNGTGKAVYIQNTNAGNGNNIAEISSNGTGKAAVIQNTNAANAANVVDVSTNGLGRAAIFQNTNAANAANVVEVSTNGIGRAGLFQNTNAANTAPNVSSISNGAGDGVQSLMSGTGKAGLFNINNAANTNFAIDAGSNGTNNVINSINTGTGRAGFFQVNNAASTADALSAVTNGTGASWAIRGTSSGTNGAGLFIQSNATNTANNLQSNQAGLGRAAFINATNAANAANAFEVNMAGTGFAANIISTNATPKALRTQGAIQFTGVSEAPGRVMATVDGSGNATWQSAASVGLVSGSGTLNFVPKWTPNGTVIGNSQVFDDGDKLSIAGPVDAVYKLTMNGTMKVKAASSDSAIAIFENTSTGANSDGLIIKLGKTHPAWNGSSYLNLPSPAAEAFRNQINTIRGWIIDHNAFNPLDLYNFSPSSLIAGATCGIVNQIIDQVNSSLSLPLNMPDVVMPAVVMPAINFPRIRVDLGDVIGSVTITNGFELFPQTTLFPRTTILPSFQMLPTIPHVPCGNLPSLSAPNISFTNVSNSLTNNNHFVSFFDKDNRELGSVRAQSVTDWQANYLDDNYFIGLMAGIVGIDIPQGLAQAVAGFTDIADSYNSIGVEYASGHADYAEWLERADPKEVIHPGDIVGVKGGKVSKNLEGAEQILAVSHNPIVLGNMQPKEKEPLGNKIAFTGQVPVKVMGPVKVGDYIVGKGTISGYGIAVSPENITTAELKLTVGRSWETNLNEGPKMVNTLIGIDNGDYIKIMKDSQDKISNLESRLKLLEEKMDKLAEPKKNKKNR